MDSYNRAYKLLNSAQRRGVDHMYGPLLVIAGPGTGKTQLLSIRAGRILETTDTSPENILCITFTDAAAAELRERLQRLLGRPGTAIRVHTFHSLGRDIMSSYPEYFHEAGITNNALDEVGQYALVDELLRRLPFRHPFAIQDQNGGFLRLEAVRMAIKSLKQAGHDPAAFEIILQANAVEANTIEPLLAEAFDIPRLSIKLLPVFEDLADELLRDEDSRAPAGVPSLRFTLGHSLHQAVEASAALGKTGPLGAWRKSHMRRMQGKNILATSERLKEMKALQAVYAEYQEALRTRNLVDFEDMVLGVVKILQTNEDLRLMLAEQYQFMMVDEYQDTSGVQNQFVDVLSGVRHDQEQPNVLVVGDDDQAIMRFQGAYVSNMIDFATNYRLSAADVVVLTDNYRSPQAVLKTSRMVMIQNEDRLEVSLVDFAITKQLQARQKPVESRIERRSFASRPEEYAWVAQNIRAQIDDGTPPEEMGIIAPKHVQLVAIIPHLQAHGIPISYERRENIIDDPAIREVIVILGILQSLSDNRLQQANSLLPEAISFPFWGISPATRIALALSAEKTGKSWLEAMLESQSELQSIAEFLLTAKDLLYTSPFELVLDVVLGSLPVEGTVLDRSPFRAYYFSAEREAGAGTRFYELLSHLQVLRDRVRQHYTAERTTVSDFLTFIDLFQKSGYRMSDNNPLLQAAKGVQLMTVHGAKGREFHDVYMVGLIESNWGPSAKGNSFRLSLPENLPIYPAGNTREDKIRLLYVALTRSKCNVFLTTHQRQDSGAPAEPLSILPDTDESLWEDQATLKPSTSPMALLETEWRSTYDVPNKPLKELLAPKLATYRLSPTHLKNFLDITRGGPHHFKTVNLLRFPEAKNFSSCFGSAVHHTLERAHIHRKEQGSPPTLTQLLSFFKQAIEHEQLTVDDLAKALLHAEQVLPVFYATEKDRLDTSDIVEQSFQKELGPIRLGGKIDKLHRTKQGNDAQWLLIDYKTGNPPPTGWESKGLSPGKKVGQHFYRQQLLFYKLLAENQLVRGERLRIHAAELRYIEPDRDSGELIQLAIADFPTDELDRLTLLVQAVWTHIQALNFPDTSSYRQDEKGIQAFEEDLLSGHI